MRLYSRLIWSTCLLAVGSQGFADSILRQQYIDLSKVTDSTVFNLKYASLLGTGRDSTGKQLVSVNFTRNKASFGQDVVSPMDWSAYNILAMKLTNRESRPLHFRLIVQLNADPKDYTNSFQGSFEIPARSTKRYCFFLNVDHAIDYGMEYMRPVLTAQYNAVRCGTTVRDLSEITRWRMSYLDLDPASVDISELRLIRQKQNFTGMIDAFGQYTDRDWNTKVSGATDLLNQFNAEQLTLATATAPGLQVGPYLGTSYSQGRWSTATSPSGNKYIVTPDGRSFWTFGLNCISEGAATPVQGRETMFRSLPSQTGRFADCYETKHTWWGDLLCYNFQKQNLMLKYGDDYLNSWTNTVKARLDYWGINTVGIQSAPTLLDNSKPFVAIIDTDSYPVRLETKYNLWEYLPDPYDASFYPWLATNFPNKLRNYLGKSNFMGLFVDNEMSWGTMKSDVDRYNVALGALVAPSGQAAKLAFLDQLQNKYASIGDLNAAWGSSFSSWNALQSNRTWSPSVVQPGMADDLAKFCHDFAAKYYTQVRQALDACGVTALYLGSRFCSYTPEVIDGAAEAVDVLSFNFYRTYDKIDWAFLNSLPKPVMLSEFGFAVQTRGTMGGPGEVTTHSERADNIKNVVSTALAQPNLVGAHMYGYGDQIASGRWADFENAGLGVVDVADVPYPETVNAFRTVTKDMYIRRG